MLFVERDEALPPRAVADFSANLDDLASFDVAALNRDYGFVLQGATLVSFATPDGATFSMASDDSERNDALSAATTDIELAAACGEGGTWLAIKGEAAPSA